MYTWRPRRRKGEEGEKEKEERGSRMEKQGASHLCPHVLQPCHPAMLLCEEWRGWLLCASMCMPMRGNAMCGISCHHHDDDELIVCQCVLQPAIPVCVSVCVCVCREHVSAGSSRRAHTQKRRESACVGEEEEGNSQSNEPTNQPIEATTVCVFVCV